MFQDTDNTASGHCALLQFAYRKFESDLIERQTLKTLGALGLFFFLNNKSLISGYHHHPFWPTDPEIPDNGPNTISCKWMKIYHLLWVGAEIWLCALGLTSLSVPPFPYYATGIKNSYSHRIIGLQIRIHKSLHQYLTANKRYLSQ